MIITKKWLEEFIDISDISTETICEKLNSIGLEVDSVTKISIPSGVVVGKVIECEKHPDADKLSITKVDIGTQILQIVCGAKNVAVDKYVAVATIGTVLGADFIIKESKLRGVDSQGMLCSTTEIGLPKLNDGIVELDDSIGELILGKELASYPLICDDIIEIELTANRGDCLSIYGVARELSAAFELSLIEFDKVVTYNNYGIGQVLQVDSSSDLDASLLYEAVDFTNFSLPLIYKLRTANIGKYNTSIIQTTIEYIIHSTGVIINAYCKSCAKLDNDLVTLNIKKDEKDFDCVYGNDKLSTIGINTPEICEDDTFVIEASYIDPELISKKVFETKIKTGDIFYRSSRGSEPNITFGLDYFTTFVSKYGGEIYNGSASILDEIESKNLDLNVKKVNAIIGQSITLIEIEKILKSLGFIVKDVDKDVLNVLVPPFRHDIKNIADVTEEIVRIIGIDNIESKPLKMEEANRINSTSNVYALKNKIRANSINNGFFETITYVFSHKESLQKYGFETVDENLDILNPITNELNTFRTTILLNLVEAASNNVKQGFKKIALFEIGTIFDKNRNETKSLSFIFSGEITNPNVSNNAKPKTIDFFSFCERISNIIGEFELKPLENICNDFIHPYQSAQIIKDGNSIGIISKLHPIVCENYDLNDTFICEIEFDKLQQKLIKASSYSKYQNSKRDLSLIAPKSLPYIKIKDVLSTVNNLLIKDFKLIDIFSGENLGDNQSLTIRFTLQSDDKTLEEDDITKVMDEILEKLKNELQIGLR